MDGGRRGYGMWIGWSKIEVLRRSSNRTGTHRHVLRWGVACSTEKWARVLSPLRCSLSHLQTMTHRLVPGSPEGSLTVAFPGSRDNEGGGAVQCDARRPALAKAVRQRSWQRSWLCRHWTSGIALHLSPALVVSATGKGYSQRSLWRSRIHPICHRLCTSVKESGSEKR